MSQLNMPQTPEVQRWQKGLKSRNLGGVEAAQADFMWTL